MLAKHFLAKRLEDEKQSPQDLSKESLEALLKYHWPGNVRELENVLEQATVWCRGATITPDHLPSSVKAGTQSDSLREETLSGRLSFEKAVQEFEKEIILDALKRTEYVQTRAADLLGISRRMLKYRMDSLGISRTAVPSPPDASEMVQ